MDCFFEFFKKNPSAAIYQPRTNYSELHMVILGHYVAYLCEMSEEKLPETLPSEALEWIKFRGSTTKTSLSFPQDHRDYIFTVPRRLKRLLEGIDEYRAVKEFISFLVRLLYHKTNSVSDQASSLEKELRFILTVLGDVWLLESSKCNGLVELENLLADLKDVADEGGSFVHSLFFLTGRASAAVVLKGTEALKANIKKLLDAVLCISLSTYVSSNVDVPVVASLLALDSLVRDLDDLTSSEDCPVDDVDVQIRSVHRGLICLQSFVKDVGPADLKELKDCCMGFGDLAREAKYLIVSFLAGDAPSWYLVSRLIHVNRRIEHCRVNLPEITSRYCSYGCTKVPKFFNKDDNVVGFEDKMRYILDQLVGGVTEVRIISIFGMPGLGKTTFARKLCDHPTVNDRFDKLSWCVVSQTYTRRNVLSDILIHIASDQFGKDVILKMEEEILVEYVHKTLMGRRYLIVMDDIWDSEVLEDLLTCFPDNGNGSRILITTRNKDVAPPNSVMYALPSLSNDQCWELLQKKVFGNQLCPPQLVESGKEIAARCCGLPLATVVMAGVLSTAKKDESTWVEVGRNLSSYMLDGGDDSVMLILKLSYDHLPQHLKPCFLYLGVFLEDQEIPVRHMMNLWIAEGFIQKEDEKNVENVAEEYLKELIDKSLVIVLKRRSDGGPKTCVMHDLLHDLCLKTCEEERLNRYVNKRYFENEDPLKVGMNSTTWMCCQYMRNHFGRQKMGSYQIEVSDMRLLRVLLYSGCSFIYLTGIEYLVSLKYLVVPDLPPSLGNLVNLEYLRVETMDDETVYLSSAILKMRKLKYVKAPSGARYGNDCDALETNKLEFLSYVVIRKVKDEKMLKCSPVLRRLKCFYTKRAPRLIDLTFLVRLESLTLGSVKSLFREEISLPSSIKKLTLVSFDNRGRKTMSMIGRLENLEVLKLVGVQFEGRKWDTRDGEFEKLKYLKLDYTTNLARWNVGSSEHFPKLERLVLYSCDGLGEIPMEIGEIPTLKIIEVDRILTQKSLVESAKRIQQEQWDMGNEDLKLILN